MADYKNKTIKRKENPANTSRPLSANSPDTVYAQVPCWSFCTCDSAAWQFSKEHLGDGFWNEILPKLRDYERQTWGEILISSKKQNHSIDVNLLNKVAQDRLIDLRVEASSIISLRLSGKHRLYGYLCGRVFCILWYDDDHGDNKTCVCRSHLKHT